MTRSLEPAWPAFDILLAALGTMPSRTGSVISTIYGDAILPRGGALALADLLVLMRRLGASEGVVRTAVSRLAADGVLVGRRIGRSSAYALTPRGRAEFEAAVPRIYGRLDRGWDGHLYLTFPTDPAQRAQLTAAGSAPLAPGVLLGFDPIAPEVTGLIATGTMEDQRELVARVWPRADLDRTYSNLTRQMGGLRHVAPPTPLDAIAARIALLHAYRRLALRTPRLPRAILGQDWSGNIAREVCIELYKKWAAASEQWLDAATDGSSPLPRGPDPSKRFSDADTRPSAQASSPVQ